MADIFLSYAKEDRAVARRLAEVLESCGWSVFWDRKIDAGDNWRQVVQSELDAAGAVVVLWSAASVDSTWVVEEAERGRRRLVSVLIASVALPIGFGSAQAIDLIDWTGGRTEGIAALVDTAAKTLQRPPQNKPRVPVSAARKRGIAAAAAVLVLIAAGALLYRSLSAPLPLMSQEILLDTSEGMKSNYDASTPRLSVAVKALDDRVLPKEDNLALRAMGGLCEQGGQLVVPFGTNRRDRLRTASKQLKAAGKTTLVSAVIAALTDIQPLPHTRRIVVITGHADQCDITEPIQELKQRLAALPTTAGQQPVVLEFRFIGFGVPAGDVSKIQEISQAVGGNAYFVNTAAELNDVLQYVLEFEPAVAHVKNVWNIVDEVGRSMSGVAQSMNAGKVDEATSILDGGETRYADMRRSFDSLAGVRSVTFAQFYKLATENRALQEQAFAAGRAWIGGGAPKDTQSSGYESSVAQWNERVAKWNEIVGKYNANINEMNRLTDGIVKETRRG